MMENEKMDEPEDMELIRAYCGGDEEAFTKLYHRYRKQLYGFLYNLLRGDSAEVDELFELTWVRVVEKLPRYKDQGKFSAWLFRVARNLFIDEVRKRHTEVVSMDSEEIPEVPDWSRRPERDLENADTARTIEAALAELSVEQREVFLLRQQGLSFKEIAGVQNCPLNTVLGRMHYAIGNLRKFILTAVGKGGEL